MVDSNKLSTAGCKYLGTPYSEMDCQAFVEKCLKDCGKIVNLPGSNAWYREVMYHGWCGTPEECKQKYGSIPKGAFLFILEKNGKEPEKYRKDGIGNASHIGIYTGLTGNEMVKIATEAGNDIAVAYDYGNGAIHSSSSRDAVATSKFAGKSISGGWNRIGLWLDEVDYGIEDDSLSPEPSPDPEPSQQPTTAVVFAHTGSTVNMRRQASIGAALVERVPVGETVEILEYGAEWCKIKWKWFRGYMKTSFLVFDDDVPDIYYSVTIPGLSKEQAEQIVQQYPRGTITVG